MISVTKVRFASNEQSRLCVSAGACPNERRNHGKLAKSLKLATALACLSLAATAQNAWAIFCDNCPDSPSNVSWGMKVLIDPLGVNIPQQTYVRRDRFLEIGTPATGGLDWTFAPYIPPHYGDITQVNASSSSKIVRVRVGENEATFGSNNGGAWVDGAQKGETLTKTATEWIYTSNDGTIYKFSVSTRQLTYIERPNGVRVRLAYSGSTPDMAALSSVQTNTGYGFKYATTAAITTVQMANKLAHSCNADLVCNAYDGGITVDNFYGNPRITDLRGKLWEYDLSEAWEWQSSGQVFAMQLFVINRFKDPTGYEANMTYTWEGYIDSFQDFRGTFDYDWGSSPLKPVGTHPELARNSALYDPTGKKIYQAFFYIKGTVLTYASSVNQTSENISKIYSITNPSFTANGTSGANQVSLNYSRPQKTVRPEGDREEYSTDGRGNTLSVTLVPKAGSGLANILLSQASYPTTCSNLKTCNKPTWTRDAKGNQTDYTYDGTHGGVLTTTLPADQNGNRLRTYNTYTGYDTGDGVIYRLTRTETCSLSSGQLVLTACPSAATTSVTVTNYGDASTNPYHYKSFEPYQITQTDGAGSVSATTTYTYDVVGNVTALDGPRTDVDDTSYKIYDANRRLICEISPDPDGGGSLPRLVTRHTYDDAGREILTQTGSGTSTSSCVPGSTMTVSNFTRQTRDLLGRVTKTEVGAP